MLLVVWGGVVLLRGSGELRIEGLGVAGRVWGFGLWIGGSCMRAKVLESGVVCAAEVRLSMFKS